LINIKVIASGSSGNAYRIDDGKFPLLLECGLSFRELQKALSFQVSSLGGVLLSHSHGDHSKSVKDFMKAGIDCYVCRGTAEELGFSGHRLKIVGDQFEIGSWTVKTFPIVHDVPGVGFYMANQDGDRLLYVSDTGYVKERFAGLSHIMIECNYSLDILNENVASGRIPIEMKNRLIKTHFSLQHLKDFFKANDLKNIREIHLIHISENNGDPARFKKEVESITGKLVYTH
jgi:phosphoribosyl 1,2-cyclic phosphodiesterase